MLTLIANLDVKADSLDAFYELLTSAVAPTRAEAGCVCYHMHHAEGDRSKVTFYEVWRDRAAFEYHLTTEHLTIFWNNRMDYLNKEVDITFYEMVSPWPVNEGKAV